MKSLFKQLVRTEGPGLLVWTVVVGLLSFLLVILFESLRSSGLVSEIQAMLKAMPPALQALYGELDSVTTVRGWAAVMGFGNWFLMLYLVYAGLFVAGIVAREVDRRTMEFLLSLPLERWQVIAVRFLGLASALLILHGAHLAGLVLGIRHLGEQPDPLAPMVWAELNSWLLTLAVGAILLVLSLFVSDYGLSVALTVGGGLGIYLFYKLTDQAPEPVASLRQLLPFHLFDPGAILIQSAVPVADMLALALITLGALGLSALLFQRKPLSL
jgi:ABC-type transport system involved in multi-copper enzyme maturation permease subunit